MGTTGNYDPNDAPMNGADKEKGVWLSHQTLHDIRNEIQAIRLGVMLLENGRLSESDCQRTFGDLNQAIDQLRKLSYSEDT